MQIFDLTHTIRDGIPVWPGTPEVAVTPISTLENDGLQESALRLTTHSCTHVDAPAHLFENKMTMDALSPAQFMGKAVVLDCRNSTTITMGMLQGCAKELLQADFLLLYTGWSRFWESNEYFGSYPTLTQEAAGYLVTMRLKGVGVDTISVDAFTDDEFPIHKTLLGAGMIVIENLRNLRSVVGKEPWLTVAPLKIKNSDGAPARVFATL